jgi:PhnB protein
MQMNPYLSFKGDCEEAFRCYERAFGGQLGTIFRYAGSPMAGDVPPDWQDKVMHTTLTVDGQVLMGGDVAPNQFEQPQGFAMSLTLKNEADTERIYTELAKDGRVIMALQKTFWAARFGHVVDRFGISWLINCESEAAAS